MYILGAVRDAKHVLTIDSDATTRHGQHARNEQPLFGSFETGLTTTGGSVQSFASNEGYEDFGFLLNDPVPEVDLDKMLQHFDHPATQYNTQQPRQRYSQNRTGDSPDWSLLSTPESGQADNIAGLMFPDTDFTFDGPLFMGDDQQSTRKQLLEPYRTASAQPTHTAHLHGLESGFGGSQGAFSVGKAGSTTLSSGRGTHLQAVPLDLAVLRLSGTTKAIRAFENAITRHNPQRFSRVLMENVATTIGSTLTQALNSPRMNGAWLDPIANSASPSSGLGWRQEGVSRVQGEPVSTSQDGYQERPASAEGASRGTTLRLPRSLDPRPHGLNANGTIARANGNGNGIIAHANANGTVARANASEPQVASTSALTSRISPFDSETPAYNGRSALMRGLSSTSPSAEMFMLKRRIPKALHSIVDRDSTAAGSNPPLQVNSTSSALPIASRQANGGAYLRLDTDNYTRPSRITTAPDISTVLSEAKSKQATAPVPARASPEVALFASQADAAKAKQPRFAVAGSKSGRYPQFESDTDTQRHRDHYGRASASSMAGMYARLALGGALLAAATLSTGISPSLLLLVLLCPQAAGNKRSHAFDRTLWSCFSYASMLPIVQCSVENSAWLAGLRSNARGLLGTCPKLEKATSLWYARCDGWRMYQEARQPAPDGAAMGHCAPVEVA